MNQITDLQAVDFGLKEQIAKCFSDVSPEGASNAFKRFLEKPDSEKVLIVKNDSVQDALNNVAKLKDDPKYKGIDLPLIMIYRDMGLSGDMNQYTQVAGVTRFINEKTVNGKDGAMRVTLMPINLTYSMLFLAWDRSTIERMALAWWSFLVPLGRKNSRFTVPYTIDGESFEVGATINSPREINTSNESIDNMRRLWGSRTMIEVNTQAVSGEKLEVLDYMNLLGDWKLMP